MYVYVDINKYLGNFHPLLNLHQDLKMFQINNDIKNKIRDNKIIIYVNMYIYVYLICSNFVESFL